MGIPTTALPFRSTIVDSTLRPLILRLPASRIVLINLDMPSIGILKHYSLKAANKEDYSSELKVVITFNGDDFNESELSTQLEVFGASFMKEGPQCKITLQEALAFLQGLSTGQRVFFKQVYMLPCQPDTGHASHKCCK